MSRFVTVLTSAITTFIVIVVAFNVPAKYLSVFPSPAPLFGNVGFTTISSTDSLSNFPTRWNTDIAALDNGKIDVGTTSVQSITTLSNLASIGTITSGTWTGSTVGVSYGGTGTSTPTGILYGDGAGTLTTIAFGTSGQFLTSSGPGSAPTFTTAAVDQAGNYSWTGLHIFSGGASSTNFSIFDTLFIGGSATSTIQGSTSGTSVLQGYLNVLGTTSTSTFSGSASTTNLAVSGACFGCPMTYTASSTAFSASAGTVTYTGSIPDSANIGIAAFTITTSSGGGGLKGTAVITRSGVTSTSVGRDCDTSTGGSDAYTLSWSSSNFAVQETADCGTASISGTMYWYK